MRLSMVGVWIETMAWESIVLASWHPLIVFAKLNPFSCESLRPMEMGGYLLLVEYAEKWGENGSHHELSHYVIQAPLDMLDIVKFQQYIQGWLRLQSRQKWRSPSINPSALQNEVLSISVTGRVQHPVCKRKASVPCHTACWPTAPRII